MQSRLMKFLGSLKLAVGLLVALAAILAVATFYESSHSSRAALLTIYRSWWFNALLALLAVNIAAAALTRWPWKRRHVGFVITHAGLIVILGGCSAAFHYGTEGMMELHVGSPPSSVVRLEDDALTAVVPQTGLRAKAILRVRNDGSISPRVIELSKNLRLTLDKYLPNSVEQMVVEDGGPAPSPAVQFRLQSDMAQQNATEWLLADSPEQSHANMGPAQIEFVVARDDNDLKRLMSAPDEAGPAQPEVAIAVGEKQVTLQLRENLDKRVDLGDSGVAVQIAGYWPDFRMDENHKPSSVSDEPNNPAAVVIVSRGDDEERQFVFGDPQMQPIVRTVRGQPIGAVVRLLGSKKPGGSTLTLIAGPVEATGHSPLHYAAQSKNDHKSGELKIGEPVQPGWMDFTVTVERYVTNAAVSQRVEPAPENPEGGFPAVLVTAHAGGEERSTWVRFGGHGVIDVANNPIHLTYTLDTLPLPFTVTLEDFVVERDEGTDNVAGWTSKVAFDDVERGLTQRASIWMNHPAWFSGYKFSQASWNPNDLQYSALQVKKDPRFVTWLTWTGAILIVAGISLMFYFRRWFAGDEAEALPSKDAARSGDRRRTKEKEAVTV